MRLTTFGGLSIASDDGAPLGGAAARRRALAVLAVIVASNGRGVSRDRLSTLFWPESDGERARANLKQALFALRRDLGQPELLLGTAELRPNPAVLTSDVAEFEHALAAGAQDPAALARAAALYTGPFLDGVHVSGAPEFERWAEAERRRLAWRAADALRALAAEAERRGDAAAAVVWWRRLATLDPGDARAALGLMTALAAAGDRMGALQHARVHAAWVAQEFGTEPDPAVTALADAIRARTTPPAPGVAAVPTGPPDESSDRTSDAAADAPADAPAEPAAALATRRAGRRPRRVRLLLAVVVGVALGVVLGILLARGRLGLAGRLDGGDAADAAADGDGTTLVAVAPFLVLDGAPAPWREGVMDVLARNLDGAGPLRTVARRGCSPSRPTRTATSPRRRGWRAPPARRGWCSGACCAPAATRCAPPPRCTTPPPGACAPTSRRATRAGASTSSPTRSRWTCCAPSTSGCRSPPSGTARCAPRRRSTRSRRTSRASGTTGAPSGRRRPAATSAPWPSTTATRWRTAASARCSAGGGW
jgi:DNA-binding SARP family transcriptional activator